MAYMMSPGRFMADWYDAQGKRHRKSLPTKQEAERYEHQQHALAQAERLRASLDKAVHHKHRKGVLRAQLAKEAAQIIGG